jgi:O-antigen/teichoic acid export membrane protein
VPFILHWDIGIREIKYKKITFANAIQVITSCIFSIILGILGYNNGMIIGMVMGIFSSILYLSLTDKELRNYLKSQPGELKNMAKEYSSFPRYMIISDMSLTACQQFIPILFSVLYNTTIVGFFQWLIG